jgi:hypothetical protein
LSDFQKNNNKENLIGKNNVNRTSMLEDRQSALATLEKFMTDLLLRPGTGFEGPEFSELKKLLGDNQELGRILDDRFPNPMNFLKDLKRVLGQCENLPFFNSTTKGKLMLRRFKILFQKANEGFATVANTPVKKLGASTAKGTYRYIEKKPDWDYLPKSFDVNDRLLYKFYNQVIEVRLELGPNAKSPIETSGRRGLADGGFWTNPGILYTKFLELCWKKNVRDDKCRKLDMDLAKQYLKAFFRKFFVD